MRFVSLRPGPGRGVAQAAQGGLHGRRRRGRGECARGAPYGASNEPGGTARTGTVGHLGLVDVGVDADDPALAGVELALVAVGRVGDLALRIALGDGRDHAAAAVDLVEVAPDRPLRLGRSAPRRTTSRRAGRPWRRRPSPRR